MTAKNCSICGCDFEEYGNNPDPFPGEKACDDCNDRFVIPARMLVSRNQPDVIKFLKRFAELGKTMVVMRNAWDGQKEIWKDTEVETL